MKNKSFITVIFLIGISIFASCFFSSCADAAGLHDQNALMLTFEFTGFPSSADGDYCLAGDFNGDTEWERGADSITVHLSGGSGVCSEKIPVTSTWINFTLCDTSWSRAWFPAVQGNSVDGKSGNYFNFYADNLDLSLNEATVVIDGSQSGSQMVYLK